MVAAVAHAKWDMSESANWWAEFENEWKQIVGNKCATLCIDANASFSTPMPAQVGTMGIRPTFANTNPNGKFGEQVCV